MMQCGTERQEEIGEIAAVTVESEILVGQARRYFSK